MKSPRDQISDTAEFARSSNQDAEHEFGNAGETPVLVEVVLEA
jgi:hypothetical protein